MGIPILSDIIDGFKWLIDFFMDKTPRQIQLLFFLALLLLFGALIPMMLHTFGVHCDSKGNVQRTSAFDFFNNMRIASIEPETVYNLTTVTPISIPLSNAECLHQICYTNGTEWYYDVGDNCAGYVVVNAYLTNTLLFGTGQCVQCQGDVNSTVVRTEQYMPQRFTLCFGNAYNIDEQEKNIVQRFVCDPENRCMPPSGYYFNYVQGKYECLNQELCNATAANYTAKPVIDIELEKNNAELMYPNKNPRDYRKLILFKCDKKLNPSLTLYGVPVFDYKIWIFLFVIIIMVYAMIHFRKG